MKKTEYFFLFSFSLPIKRNGPFCIYIIEISNAILNGNYRNFKRTWIINFFTARSNSLHLKNRWKSQEFHLEPSIMWMQKDPFRLTSRWSREKENRKWVSIVQRIAVSFCHCINLTPCHKTNVSRACHNKLAMERYASRCVGLFKVGVHTSDDWLTIGVRFSFPAI